MSGAAIRQMKSRFTYQFMDNSLSAQVPGYRMSDIAQFLLLRYSINIQQEDTAMNVSLGERWEKFVENTVQNGRYGSASEVVREGLRLVEEREARLNALRDQLNASIAAGGDVSEEGLDAALDAESKTLTAKGF